MVKQQILHLLPLFSAEPEHLFRICLRFVKLNPFPPLCAASRRAHPDCQTPPLFPSARLARLSTQSRSIVGPFSPEVVLCCH